MSYQQRVIDASERAMEILFRTARAMPEDKLDWKPLDQGRSTLDQLQECSWSPNFYRMVLEQKAFPSFDESFFEAAKEERQRWLTIDDCEKNCQANSNKLYKAIRQLSEGDLDITVHIPSRNIDLSLAHIAMSHFAHLQYHAGQINYIQTLYGDAEMH